ncbi:MAG: NAD(P)-dependent oxidoreductase [Thermoleophilaceae bacterium]
MTDKTVAVLGAGGTMGRGMSRNLLRAGFDVRAWNRSREKAEPLAADGATVVSTPAEAAQGASWLLTILSDGDAVLETIEQALPGAEPGVMWVQTSTIGIEATERCIEIAGQAGVLFVDSPVLGTKQPAEEGTLTVLASGPDEARERVQPIFDAIGQRTLWVGLAGAGSRLKLAVNVWLLAVVEGAAETFALAEGLGLDPQLVLETVKGGPLDLPYLQLKGRMMIERSFEPSFRLELAAKDARLAAEAAKRAGLDLALLDTVASRVAQAAEEHGGDDIAAAYLASAPTRA